MTVTTTCPDWCQCSHTEGHEHPCHDGASWGSTPNMHDDDLDVIVAAGSIETGALRVYLSVERSANLTPTQAREVARKLLEAASWVANHSVE
ncbi:MAG TPA: hypothetical protein VF317_02375 [Dermatophilaceae bacterium]|jgi:hypothetical protein